MVHEKVDTLRDCGAEVVVSADCGCLLNIHHAAEKRRAQGEALPRFVHLASFLRERLALAALLVLLVPGVASAACDSFSEYQQKGWAWMYLAAFGFGFQTSLTPCVYPMIPITLTSVGATPGMPITVWILGPARAIPRTRR